MNARPKKQTPRPSWKKELLVPEVKHEVQRVLCCPEGYLQMIHRRKLARASSAGAPSYQPFKRHSINSLQLDGRWQKQPALREKRRQP